MYETSADITSYQSIIQARLQAGVNLKGIREKWMFTAATMLCVGGLFKHVSALNWIVPLNNYSIDYSILWNRCNSMPAMNWNVLNFPQWSKKIGASTMNAVLESGLNCSRIFWQRWWDKSLKWKKEIWLLLTTSKIWVIPYTFRWMLER